MHHALCSLGLHIQQMDYQIQGFTIKIVTVLCRLFDTHLKYSIFECTNEKQGDVMFQHFHWSVCDLPIAVTVKQPAKHGI